MCRSYILRLGRIQKVASLLALVAAGSSCGEVVRADKSPVLVVIDSLQAARGNTPSQLGGTLDSPVVTTVTSPAPCSTTTPCQVVFADVGQVVLHTDLKNIGNAANPATPTSNNDVTITRYHVDYVRSDGRNTQGVDTPFSFDGAATGTIKAGGSLTLGFEIVRAVAKEEAPLAALVSSSKVINTIAHVTFFGQDVVGNEVRVTGYIQIAFGNFLG